MYSFQLCHVVHLFYVESYIPKSGRMQKFNCFSGFSFKLGRYLVWRLSSPSVAFFEVIFKNAEHENETINPVMLIFNVRSFQMTFTWLP